MMPDATSKFPPIPKALMDHLEKLYPEKCPSPSWTEREVWMRVGERQVLRFLWARFQEQQGATIIR